MKVSIWQQFSSNHSASFDIVGKFKSTDEAEKALVKLREIVQRVGDYYRKTYPDETVFMEKQISERNLPVSSVEKKIKAEYNVLDWPNGLDWTYFDQPNQVVQRFEHLVFVSNQIDTWTGYMPFVEIMEVLGAEVAAGTEIWKEAYVSFTCKAPDAATAQVIVTTLEDNDVTLPDEVDYQIKLPDWDDAVKAHIKHDGTTMSVTDIFTHADGVSKYDTAQFLTTLTDYLKQKGCTDFNYEIEERE